MDGRTDRIAVTILGAACRCRCTKKVGWRTIFKIFARIYTTLYNR